MQAENLVSLYLDLKINTPPEIEYILKSLEEKGFKSYIVGGTVRDFLLGKETSDYDITTSALPGDVHKIFASCIDTGLKHGTVTVIVNGIKAEVTTFRSDGDYLNHRSPESVTLASDLKTDLERRDFTMNALAYNGKIIDLFGGFSDIKSKIIKSVGDPYKRFDEDALRMMRAARFSCTLGFKIDKSVKKAIKEMGSLISFVSCERIKTELDKIVLSDFTKNLSELMDTGFFGYVLPTLQNAIDKKTDFSVLKKANSLYSKYALLFIIINEKNPKPFLDRYKFSNDEKRNVLSILKYSLIEMKNIKTTDLKEILSKSGEYVFKEAIGIKNILGIDTKDLTEKFDKVKNEPYLVKHLCITGNDLIKIGITGSEIGKTLEFLRKEVIRNKNLNEKDTLIKSAMRYNNENKSLRKN